LSEKKELKKITQNQAIILLIAEVVDSTLEEIGDPHLTKDIAWIVYRTTPPSS
jgi:hypothetical protein